MGIQTQPMRDVTRDIYASTGDLLVSTTNAALTSTGAVTVVSASSSRKFFIADNNETSTGVGVWLSLGGTGEKGNGIYLPAGGVACSRFEMYPPFVWTGAISALSTDDVTLSFSEGYTT